jgi:quinol monooxygenase YgiN
MNTKHLKAHAQRCLSTEPGTLKFEILVPKEEADTLMLYEVYVYASPEAFQAHWTGPSLQQVKQDAAEPAGQPDGRALRYRRMSCMGRLSWWPFIRCPSATIGSPLVSPGFAAAEYRPIGAIARYASADSSRRPFWTDL